MSDAERQLERIQAARSVVREAESDWEAAKEAAKEAKSVYEDAVNNMKAIIDRSNQRELDFPEDEDGSD